MTDASFKGRQSHLFYEALCIRWFNIQCFICMKKVILGSIMFLAGMLSLAVLLEGDLQSYDR